MFLVNGSPDASSLIFDRGFLYGDGLFETIRARNGVLEFLNEHRVRLLRGCERLGIDFVDCDLLFQEAQSLLLPDSAAVVRLVVTRGSGGRGYRWMDSSVPSRIVMISPLPLFPNEFYTHGVMVGWCETRLAHNARLAGIKHLNRLEQVLARAEWQDEFQECLVEDHHGRVIEGTMSNLFVVKDEVLFTPSLNEVGIEGVMREVVLRIARREGVKCAIGPLTRADVEVADAVFMTNSIIGIWPVRSIGNVNFCSASALTGLLQAAVASELECGS